MANDDKTLWITYNGELYNFLDLRSELEGRGFSFRSKSDTEVLLKAYEAWGRDCLPKLRGMAAFAIWDGRKNELLLVRGRMGIKPLYYSHQNGALVFGSEISTVLASGTAMPCCSVSSPSALTMG